MRHAIATIIFAGLIYGIISAGKGSMIGIGIIVLVGLTTKQPFRYWRNCIAAILFQGGWMWAFDGQTGILRDAFEKAPAAIALIWMLFVVFAGWGIPIYLIKRGYQRKQKAGAPREPSQAA